LWAACQDLGVVVNNHSGSGSPDYGDHLAAGAVWIAEQTFFSRRTLTHLLLGGVFERFPGLKFVITEQGSSWIPLTLAQRDAIHAQMQKGRIGELKYEPDEILPMAPSEYFRRNVWVAASFPSRGEAQTRHEIGIDHYLWGSDYPHYEAS